MLDTSTPEPTTRACPLCGEGILATAQKCRFCQSWVNVPPGFWLRLYAYFIDTVIIGLAVTTFDALVTVLTGEHLTDAMVATGSVAGMTSYVIHSVAQDGATLGKKWCGLKITRLDGVKPTWGQAFGRYFAEGLSMLLFCLGYLVMLLRSDRRALHDLMAGTRVVYAEKGDFRHQRMALTPRGVIGVLMATCVWMGWNLHAAGLLGSEQKVADGQSWQDAEVALGASLIGMPLGQAEIRLIEHGYSRDGETKQITRIKFPDHEADALLFSTEDGWSKVLILEQNWNSFFVKEVINEPDHWLSSWFFPSYEEERVRVLEQEAKEYREQHAPKPQAQPTSTPKRLKKQPEDSQARRGNKTEPKSPPKPDPVTEAEKAMGF